MSDEILYSEDGETDPLATAMAVSGASRAKADAFLDDQRHHIHEQLKHLHLSVWEKQLGVVLRLATIIVGIAFAAGVALLVWQAANSSGLIVESFAVPPDMAARGLSGDVVASQVLDKLTAMQEATSSSRGPQSYQNNWGNNLKVEIPETGVSVGEMQRFLQEWLGHDTRIRGEVFRTASGIAVTARAGAETGATFEGKESDLDALVQKAAEHVYGSTQPYRYANYLDRNVNAPGLADRRARARAIYWELTRAPDLQERAWAWNGLGTLSVDSEGPLRGNRTAAAYYRRAIQVWPDFTVGHFALGFREFYLNREENELAAFRAASSLLHRSRVPDVNPKILETVRANNDSMIAFLTGDWAEGARLARAAADLHVIMANQNYHLSQLFAFLALARLHDAGAIAAYFRDLGITTFPNSNNVVKLQFLATRGDWRGLVANMRARDPKVLEQGYGYLPVSRGLHAWALAEMGDAKGAEALIAPAPADCDGCNLARAHIAELQGQHARADFWFARVEIAAPSIPFADTDWGEALLARGKPDAGIEKFKLASAKGPHFADPLEGWGEALMAKNQSHLALAKFAAADKYAPNWGRLHLKWGEALVYAGKKDEARAQFQKAATLDLSVADKAELAKANRS